MQHNEHEIITRILDGDGELYGQLIDRYKNGLYRHCFAIVRDEDMAEDLAQDAFIEAYVHLAQYNPTYRFSTWLYKIATNKALAHLRKNQTIRLNDEQLDQIVSTLPPTDRAALDRELRDAVAQLPRRYSTVITMRYWQGHSYKTMAKQLNVPLGSVKSWVSRAKQQLKEILS